jgi:hypothetical protein
MADSKPINWAYPFKAKAAAEGSGQDNATPELYYDALAKAKDGFYPLGANGLWHGGIHFDNGTAASLDQSAIHCIADGEVVAYRIDERYPTSQYGEGPTVMHLPFSSGFVLVKHSLALPEPTAPAATGESGAAEAAPAPASAPLTFYSLYMHLLDWTGYKAAAAPTPPDFLGETLYSVKPDKATDNLVGLRVRTAAKTGTVKALLTKGSKVKVGDPDPTSAKWRKLLAIVAGSAIPALSGEELGWVYTGEMDEVPGETDTYLVADDAQDKEPTLVPNIGLNVRKAGNSSSKITGLLPVGAKFRIKSGSGSYRELLEIVEGQGIAPLSANSVQNIKGFVHFDSLQTSQIAPELDKIRLLAQPKPIKAGAVVGHMGRYQNHDDGRPRSLVHVEVFSCDDVPAFIARSRAIAAQLPADQKTLIKVHAGSSILQPSAADAQVPAGRDLRLSSDSPKEGCWAKVQQYAELKIDKSSLGSYDATHKRYALNAAQKSALAIQLGVAASELLDTADFLLEYYDADGSNPQTYTGGSIPAAQPMRKIGVRLNTAYWVERGKLNAQGGRSSTSGTLEAWKTFPLQTSADGKACGYDRILLGTSWGNLSTQHKAIAPDNTRWWYVTVGDKDGQDISGWVPEVDPIISKHSPWEWPGFSTLQDQAPLDAHLARTLDATRRTTEEEAQSYAALIEEAERGPILSELYKVIDLPDERGVRDNKLTPVELKTALGKPWLAQQLSQLISQHESEWFWNEGKWNQLDKLMDHTPTDPNLNWVAEKKRIETLSWWKELAGQPGITADGVAWHLHPVGVISNFSNSCPDECKVEIYEMETTAGTFTVSKRLFELILQIESYSKFPYALPDETSGITIAYGYDLGQQTAATIDKELSGLYTANEIKALKTAIGKKGSAARSHLSKVNSIAISKEDALKLAVIMKQRYAQQVVDIYPESISLHPDCQGALLSLVINRGNALTHRAPDNTSRIEMKQIQEDLEKHQIDLIPSRFRSMKRLWANNPAQRGVAIRREKEATFFEEALKCNCWK